MLAGQLGHVLSATRPLASLASQRKYSKAPRWIPSSSADSVHAELTRASIPPSILFPLQRRTLVHRDMVGLVALDVVLRLILARVVSVAFVFDVLGVHLDDFPTDVSSLRVPT